MRTLEVKIVNILNVKSNFKRASRERSDEAFLGSPLRASFSDARQDGRRIRSGLCVCYYL